MTKEELNSELQAFETALASLHPLPPNVDRDRIMFVAGRKAGSIDNRRRRGSWLWPLATIATGIVAFACGVAIIPSPKPLIVQRTAYVAKEVWPTVDEVSEPIRKKRRKPFGTALYTVRAQALDVTFPPILVHVPEREMPQPLEVLSRPVIRAHSICDLEKLLDYSIEADRRTKGNDKDVDHERRDGREESRDTEMRNRHTYGQYGLLFAVADSH